MDFGGKSGFQLHVSLSQEHLWILSGPRTRLTLARYSAALAARVPTTAMFGNKSGGKSWRFSR
jgi:hypothetical protein